MAGGSGSKKRSPRKRKRKRQRKENPATQLTDDLLVDILSRVPYRSLCRFRCVSTRWRALISDPYYGRRLPQSLAGFLHDSPFVNPYYCFTNVPYRSLCRPLIDTSFPFLPDREREGLTLEDSCNGLILCRNIRYTIKEEEEEEEFHYLVVNPATEEWVAVPVSWRGFDPVQTVHLGFDPAFSTHFYIFEFQLDVDDDYTEGGHGAIVVKIYSSETGVWCHKQSGWSFGIEPQFDIRKSVFVNGVLYVIATQPVIAAVDVKGETWRIIDFPKDPLLVGSDSAFMFIDLSQGRLHLANESDMLGDNLSIWVLEDNDTDEWILKHRICYRHLVGREYLKHFLYHQVVAIHPHRNMIFLVFGHDEKEKILMSYDMDSGRGHFIRDLGNIDFECFLPYVPLFSKSLPDALKQ